MRQAIQIFRKEFRSYFVTPIAYIVIAIFLLVTGWFFFATFFLFGQATLRNFFALLPIIFSFVIPGPWRRFPSDHFPQNPRGEGAEVIHGCFGRPHGQDS